MAAKWALLANAEASSSRKEIADSPKLRIVRDPSARIRQAIRDNNVALLQRLQDKADLRNTDKGRLTSLSWAAAELSLEVFEWLLVDYGHDDQELSKDADDNTILHILASIPTPPGIPPTLNPKHMDLPVLISDRSPSQQSALALRMTHIYVTLFPFVLDWANAGGKTALHIAAQAGNAPFIALLADFGADIDEPDHQGNTPLHYAAAWGHIEAIRVLLEKGCQYTPRNLENATAADYAYSDTVYNAISSIVREIFDNSKKRRQEERNAGRQAREDGGGGRHRSESTSTAASMASGLGSLHSNRSGNSPLQFDPSTMPPPPSIPQRLAGQSPALGYPQSGLSSARNTPPMSRQGSEGVPPHPYPLQPVDGVPSRPSPILSKPSPSLPSRSDSLPSSTARPYLNHNPSYETAISSTSAGSGSTGPPPRAPIALASPIGSDSMPPPNMAAMGSVATRRGNTAQAIHGFQSGVPDGRR